MSQVCIELVCARITDADEVAKARLFPYQVWAAYSHAPSDSWKRALGTTLEMTTQNIPRLDRTLVLVDMSGSMQAPVTNRSAMSRVQVAAVMAAVTATRSTNADIAIFGQTNKMVKIRKGASVLKTVEDLVKMVGAVGHSTMGHTAIRDRFDPKRHDRVVMFTDDQQHDAGRVDISHVPTIYTVDLAGYRPRSTPTGERGHYTLAGFSDATFSIMQTLRLDATPTGHSDDIRVCTPQGSAHCKPHRRCAMKDTNHNKSTPIRERNVLTWATDLDAQTLAQAHRTASLEFVRKPLALMADAHLGMGATIGSVVATEDSIIPAAVGVDIGCGMIAQKTVFTREQLDPHLTKIHNGIRKSVPSGQPRKGNRNAGSHKTGVRSKALDRLVRTAPEVKTDRFNAKKIAAQFGTLGGGNHFVELTVDENDRVWIVLHSGSRGPGNLFAQEHIGKARNQMKKVLDGPLVDPDLAHFVQGTEAFDQYIDGMLWAQDYALENRAEMMNAVVRVLAEVMDGQERGTSGRSRAGEATRGTAGSDEGWQNGQWVADGEQIQCHHNYASCEVHHGQQMWVTRKGAIDASEGKWGIIPGSMATGSFIVSGRGNPDSYRSASHGAGRKMSRTAARKHLTVASLVEAMDGITWNNDAKALLDEHPDAYKDIGEVMDNQSDLVKVEHRLDTILNYKGT